MFRIAKKKLVIEVRRKGDKSKKRSSWKIVLGIIALLFLIYILTSGKPFTKNAVIKHNVTVSPGQPIIVEEPYTVVEYYTVKEPVGPKFCEDTFYNVSFSTPSKSLISMDGQGYWNCSFLATSTEAVSGNFTLFVNWMTRTGGFLSENIIKGIDSGQTIDFSFLYKMRDLSDTPDCLIQKDLLPKRYTCRVLEPAPYAIVEKARTVTKYRNVTKTSNATVTTETSEYTNKTYSVNKFFGYEQPWYLGY